MVISIAKRIASDRLYLVILGVHAFLTLVSIKSDALFIVEFVFIPLFCFLISKNYQRHDAVVFLTRYPNNRAVFWSEQKELAIHLILCWAPTLIFFFMTGRRNFFERNELWDTGFTAEAYFVLLTLILYVLAGEIFLLLKRIFNGRAAVGVIITALVFDGAITYKHLSSLYLIIDRYAYAHLTQYLLFSLMKMVAVVVALYVLYIHVPKDYLQT